MCSRVFLLCNLCINGLRNMDEESYEAQAIHGLGGTDKTNDPCHKLSDQLRKRLKVTAKDALMHKTYMIKCRSNVLLGSTKMFQEEH